MANNATPWPKMIRAVYASFDTGRHQGDATARRVMDRAVSWLCAGLELSPRLQDRLIDNINMRTKFVVQAPEQLIRLTRDQLRYAMRTNPEWFALGLDGQDLPGETGVKTVDLYDHIPPAGSDFHTFFTLLSQQITTSFTLLSHSFPGQARDLAQHLVSLSAEKGGCGTTASLAQHPKVMENEEKESNHDLADMTSAQAASFHDARGVGQELAHYRHELHEPQADVHVEQHEPAARQDSMVASAPQPEHDGEVHGEGASWSGADAVTIWVKEDARGRTKVSGFLDRGGDKFALNFTGFDHALDRIPCSPGNAAFRDRLRDMGEVILPIERSASGVSAKASLSALFARGDAKFTRKPPVTDDAAVVLEWEGGVPARAFVLTGEYEGVEVTLSQQTADRFKGEF